MPGTGNVLTKETVRLGAEAAGKADAIRQSGRLLVEAGYVAPAYVDGMLAREKILSTYLGNGIAIPHGRFEDLKTVNRTGISVLQLPQGVDWQPGEKAYLVIGLAATSGELGSILNNLVEVLKDPDTIQQLAHTADPMLIVQRLTRGLNDRS